MSEIGEIMPYPYTYSFLYDLPLAEDKLRSKYVAAVTSKLTEIVVNKFTTEDINKFIEEE